MPSPRKQAQNTIKALSPVVKYKKYTTVPDPLLGTKKLPSQLLDELTHAQTHVEGWRPKPSVVQLLNIAEYSHQVDSSVGLDEPLFQPFPPQVTFHNPQAYKAHEAVLYLRNNDKVARRVKVLQPDTPLLKVRRVKGSAAEDKVASGMEVAYSVIYTPEDTEQFHYDLVVCTEREKFLVPCTVAGSKAALDFPDHLQFPMTPAKCSASQTCLVTNMGTIDADFTLTAYPPFRVEPARAQLPSGDTMQCSIHFAPQSTGTHTGDLEIQYEQGDLVYASLSGDCAEVDVQLSQPAVSLQATYINTRSQGTFRIINHCSSVVNYTWQQHATAEEDFDSAAADISDILKETSTRPLHTDQSDMLDSLLSENEDSDIAEMATANTKRRRLESDQHLFSNSSFHLSPAQGSIWPGMEAEITVTFQPDHAREYKAMAYCDVGGRATRLPIQLCGTGIGPKAVFSYDLLDVGEAFINTPHKYEVELLNRGQIPAQFKLLPFESLYASKFSFRPREGTLDVGEVKTICVQLQSDLLGSFSDIFSWSLNGSSESLKLQFKGSIVGPKFKVDVDAVDFGLVAFGFRYAKEFTLTNTCAIPMQYAWRVPKDSLDPVHKEFTVVPSSGTVLPLGRQVILVEFSSQSLQVYNEHQLALDIMTVGEGLHNLPIKAECVVPMVTPNTDLLDFEECYLRYPYQRIVTLTNASKLPCKCEVMGQEARSQGLAIFTTSPNSGVIPAKGTLDVVVTLQASRLGRIQLPLQIKVLGSRRGPLECIIGATAVGPTLHFGTDTSKLTPKTEVAFGSIDVLQAKEHVLSVHNPTDIVASLKTLVEGRDSPFRVAPREAQLQPHESMAVKVTVLLDEAKQHKDVLHLFVTEGDDITIPLSATGCGHVVTCPAIADGVDFGPQFTGHRFSKEVVIQNQGRHPVTLAWANTTFAALKSKQAQAQKKAAKTKQEETTVVEAVPVYAVNPDRVTIAAKSSCQLEFFGFSAQPGQIEERFVCTFGSGAKSKQIVFDMLARANIAPPMLQFSERKLDWCHSYTPGQAAVPMTRPLTVQNVSPLSFPCSLRTSPPFSVDQTSFQLAPQETVTVTVTFDPAQKTDLVSGVLKRKIAVVYADASQTDLELVGEVCFPNLHYDMAAVEFGSVLNDTTARQLVVMTNTSKVDAAFHWQFVESETTGDERPDSAVSNHARIAVGASAFDILPTRGVLKAGQSRTVEFAYYARPGQKASTTAVCDVEGGPTYTLPVTADSNAIKYTVEPQTVDVGPVLFDRATERDVSIHNKGRVQFSFEVDTSELSRPSVCDVTPKTGTVLPGQHALVKLKVVAGMPDQVQELLKVKVAHFDPVTVSLVGQGVYPALSLTLPRVRNEEYDQAVIEAQDALRAAQLKPQQAPRSTSPPPSRGGRGSSPRPKSPQSPRRTGRSEVTPKVQLEAEADRLLIIKQVSRQAAQGRRPFSGGQSVGGSPMPKEAPGSKPGTAQSQRSNFSADGMQLVAAEYVLDFGHVIKGMQKVRKFKAINTGSVGVSFVLDTKTMEKAGFFVSPDKVPVLAGAPTHAALELTITLQTARLKLARGLLELAVPLRLKAGPTVMLHMKACLLTPDVQLSSPTLPFGPVQTGKCKVMMVLMHNTREVPAEWQVKPPADVAAAADWSHFKCEPEQGLLPPGQKQLLKVMFTPGGNSHAPQYKQGIPIKITHNSKGPMITCTGSSFMLKAVFDPPLLDLGAILPRLDSQQPNQILLKLINTADVDMEVFSLEWDKQYLEEEAVLREAGGFDANDMQLLDPLPPGAPLWSDLPAPPTPAADGPQPVPPEAGDDATASLGGLAGSKAAAPTTLSSWVSIMPGTQTLADSLEEEEPLVPGGLNLIIMGPPLAGKSVQARLLADRYQLVVTTIDDLLMEAAQLPDSKVDAAFADELFAKVIGLPVDQQEEGYVAPHTQLQASELEAMVSKALVAALAEEQYTRGVVIDSLTSQYLSPDLAANLLLSSMGLQKTLHPEALPPPPPPAPPKGKKAEPLPPAPPLDLTAFHWTGDKHVYFVELDMSPDAVKTRYREGLARAAAEEAALLTAPSPPPEPVSSSARSPQRSRRLPAPAQQAARKTPKKTMKEGSPRRKSKVGAPTADQVEQKPASLDISGAAPSAVNSSGGGAATASAASEDVSVTTAENTAGEDSAPAELSAAIAAWQQFEEQAKALLMGRAQPDNMAQLLSSQVEGKQPAQVTMEVCGIKYQRGVQSSLLPEVPTDADRVPESYLLQIVKRPRQRSERKPITHFKLLTPVSQVAETDEASIMAGEKTEQTRWVVPARSSRQLIVQFQSEDMGSFKENLVFEVAGCEGRSSITISGVCDQPHISIDPKQVFSRRMKTRPDSAKVARHFIMSSGQFEFGPLLAGKDSQGYREGGHPEHCTRLHMTNCGKFDLHVDWELKSQPPPVTPPVPAGKAAKPKSASAAAKDAAALTAAAPVFLFEPRAMDLKVGETQDLTLWAFPKALEAVQDMLLGRIASNPTLVEFPISCVGAKPQVEVRLDMPLPVAPPAAPADAAAAAAAPAVVPEPVKAVEVAKPAAAAKGAAKKGKEPPAPELPLTPRSKLVREGVVFERLLIGQTQHKAFIINNTSLLPVKWRLAGADALPQEFKILPSSGEIPARQQISVTVEFTAFQKKDLSEKVTLQTEDVAGVQGLAQEVAIALKGEAYAIDVAVKYPDPGAAALDYGLLKATQAASKSVTLVNTGKYAVAFAFHQRGAMMKELFNVTPAEGSLAPGAQQAVELAFNRGQVLKKEVTLADSQDISVAITEPLTGRKEVTLHLKISARAVFSKYSITPARALNFGPVLYNTSAGARTLEVTNVGEVPVSLRLFDPAKSLEAEVAPVVPQVTPRGAAKKGAEPAPSVSSLALALGPFSLQPATAALPVGAKQTIMVNFNAQGAKLSLQQVGIDISDRDYADHPEGIMYEVAGESVIPGIDCQNMESIFEEHTLCSQLDPLAAQHNVFALTERKFDFGAVLAAVGGAALQPGVKANLKFTNIFKVQATVNFSIKPGGAQAPGPFPMTAQPAQLIIPANESRFMAVHFAPTAIRSYSAAFEAVVEAGADAATGRFTCELRGEGTLPSLTLELPQADKGPPALRFPRLLMGKRASLGMSVTNNGILPATARISMDPHSCFQLAPGPALITLATKQSHRIALDFHASVVKQHAHEVVIEVQQNPYEKHRVAVMGECYTEALALEGLPQDSTDELRLPDLPLNQTGHTAFVLHNMSDKPYRFEWPALAPLTFAPSVGHLPAGAVKDIMVTYLSDKPLQLKAAVAALKATQLKMAPGAAPSDWDNRTSAASPAAVPEPKVELASAKEAPPVSLSLKVSVVVDDARVECDAGPINFKPTVMFQTRLFNFSLKNTGLGSVDYKWAVQTLGGATDTSGTFVVTPEGGHLAAGETASVTVRFSPQEVEDCSRRLVATIPNLSASLQAPNRAITASVLRPWCHFDLPPSDYITAGRRSLDMPSPGRNQGPLDPATKVLEMESLGVKVHNVKRFWVLNPTSMAYSFAWEALEMASPSSPPSPFQCSTMTGVLAPGKRYEMVFQYTPNEDKLQESFWRFKIPEHKLDVPVLVVGHVSEPRVTFDRPSLSFGKVLVGGRTHATINLVNSEYMPFQFDLDKASYDASPARLESTGREPVLIFEPSSGTVPAGGQLPIAVTFAPTLAAPSNFNVVCMVKKKPTKLTLNVKGEGYAVHDSLQVEGADGRLVELSPDAPNHLDFGQVLVNDHVTKAVTLLNAGSLMYEYNWKLGGNPRLAVTPLTGSVGAGSRVACELSFSPISAQQLYQHKVTCQVVNGRTYTLLLSGNGHKPALDFSFLQHDFGPCFVKQAGMQAAQKVLHLKNNDSSDLSFDIEYENSDSMTMDCPPSVLAPGASQDVSITFSPCEARLYREEIPFNINGLYTVRIAITGEGSPLKLELANAANRSLNLGAVSRGGQTSKTVQVCNRSKVTCQASFVQAAQQLAQCAVDMTPAGNVTIPPRDALDITFFFRPTQRMRAWQQEVAMQVAGVSMPLLTLSAACLGTQLTLSSDNLPFGTVVLGSEAKQRLQVENDGDVGTKYGLDVAALGPHFAAFPASGFLAPNKQAQVEITFHPRAIHPDIRVDKVRCKVEGGEDSFLTLTGACSQTQAQAASLDFKAAVRGSTTQSITLANPSVTPWQLKPLIQNDYWSGPEVLMVPAGAEAAYAITYRPLSMSTPEKQHEGSVFFPIPDGTGLLYKLAGVAQSPMPAGTVQCQVVAKQAHVQGVKVANWLNKPQRFKVVIDLQQADPATQLTAPPHVDVAGLSQKDCKLHFYTFTEGQTTGTVTFQNQATGEYIFYNLAFTASPAGLQGTLRLEGPVRSPVSQTVAISNPLQSEVVMAVACSSKQVVVPTSVTVPAGGSANMEVAYRPLLVAEAEASLKLSSKALGMYEYLLKLKGTAAGPEGSLNITCPLGSSETQVFRFQHWLAEKTDYKASFRGKSSGAFECKPSSVAAAPAGPTGVEQQVEVTFEPSSIGDNYHETLVVSSSAGGEYECQVNGTCLPPKPSGPFEIVKGTAQIPWKNIFTKQVEFFYSVDNTAFTVKASESLPAKKTTNIAVTYKEDPSKPRTAKLMISCPGEAPTPWVFYLQA